MMADMNQKEEKKGLAEKLSIHWAKTGLGQFSMRDAVNDYMEAIGANKAMTEESIVGRRKITAISIAINCIHAIDRNQLRELEHQLNRIAEDDAPRLSRGMHR